MTPTGRLRRPGLLDLRDEGTALAA